MTWISKSPSYGVSIKTRSERVKVFLSWHMQLYISLLLTQTVSHCFREFPLLGGLVDNAPNIAIDLQGWVRHPTSEIG